jgi:hypothetical protein
MKIKGKERNGGKDGGRARRGGKLVHTLRLVRKYSFT